MLAQYGMKSWKLLLNQLSVGSGMPQFCFQDKRMKEENCAPIVPLGEGRYDVPLDSQLKWNKVSPGTSYGL
jgi:hypothetical protein